MQTGGARKPVERGWRGADPRAAALLAPVGLAGGDAVGDDGKAARCHIAADRPRRELGRRKLVADERDKVVAGTALHPRRDLLRQEFEQQFAGHARRPPYLSFRGAAPRRTRNP